MTNISKSKKRLYNLTAVFTGNAIIGKVLSIPSRMIVAYILGPATFGTLAIVKLINKYLGYFDFGLSNALTREAQIEYGKKNFEKVEEIKQIVFSGYLVTILIGLISLGVLFILNVKIVNSLSGHIIILIILLSTFSRSGTFLRSYIIADGKFEILAKLDFIKKIVTPVLTILSVIIFKLEGLILTLILIGIMNTSYQYFKLEKPKFYFQFKFSKILELLRTGFIIHVNKVIGGFVATIAVILLKALGTDYQVGIYTFAFGLFLSGNVPFMRAISMTVHRNMMIDGGKYGEKSYESYKKYLGKPLLMILFIYSLITGAYLMLYIFAIKIFLNDFSESIPLMILFFVAFFFQNTRHVIGSFIIVTRTMIVRTITLIIGLGFTSTGSYFLLSNGYGVYELALLISISYIFISLFLLFYSLLKAKVGYIHSLVFIAKLILLISIFTSLILLFDQFYIFDYQFNNENLMEIILGVFDVIIKILGFIIVTIVSFIVIFYDYRLLNEIKDFFQYIIEKLIRKRSKFSRLNL